MGSAWNVHGDIWGYTGIPIWFIINLDKLQQDHVATSLEFHHSDWGNHSQIAVIGFVIYPDKLTWNNPQLGTYDLGFLSSSRYEAPVVTSSEWFWVNSRNLTEDWGNHPKIALVLIWESQQFLLANHNMYVMYLKRRIFWEVLFGSI